jgi:drug/metabolite transporter (DMT)-like permease
MARLSAQHTAVLQALLVTFLWSASFVLISLGLATIPALTFAGVRYTLGFLCLLPVALRSGALSPVRGLPPTDWLRLAALGLLYYAVTQGTVFLALSYLRPVTMSMIMSFTPALVALLGAPLLGERPTWLQWAGIVVFLAGAAAYFGAFDAASAAGVGIAITAVCLFANAGSSVLGRYVNLRHVLSPLGVTTASMGVGAVVLLVTGLASQGLPPVDATSWLIIGCLAVVNTAFAFTLWNHTLRSLTATQSSVINNTMLIQIAVLGWVFLGDHLTAREIAGLVVAAAGALVVQLRPRPAASVDPATDY